MTAQQFAVMDVLRLQVQEGWPDLPNLILNPSGEGGAWGWQTKPNVWIRSNPTVGLVIHKDTAGATYVQTESLPIPKVTAAGFQVRGALTVQGNAAPIPLSVQFTSFDADAETFGAGPALVATAPGVYDVPAWDVPVGTTSLRLKVLLGVSAGAGEFATIRDAVLMFGTEEEIDASDPLSDPPWVDVLGSAASITVDRDELNIGVLEATLYDSTLDPASTDLIRPGKRCRLQALVDDEWEYLFNGKLDNPSSAYEVRDPHRSDLRRVQIKVVASDPASDLAGDPRTEGVSTIDELPYVLLGTGVPFNVNGSSDAIDPDDVIVVAVNDQATALDQVAVTRDSVLGFAWIDRSGVLQAWDRGELAPGVAVELDETMYSDVNIDFDVDRTFNTIKVLLLRINPGTGETEEIPFGPYVDEPMRRQWRTRNAEFKVQGVDEDLIDDYANEILALNARPVKRINSVTLPLRTVDELEAFALRDLYELVSLSNDRAGVVDQQSRITSLKHRITIKKQGARLVNRWWLDLEFSTDGNVASPQVTPSPTVGGARTVGQLLRPIGEVTMWYGAFADIPAGWLPCNGAAFDDEQYPLLAELLGVAVLPNMEDRFPIGAGTKALGTSGGSVATDPPTVAGVGWAVDNTGGNSAPKLSEFNNHVHDVLPPWRSLWFIIRAA